MANYLDLMQIKLNFKLLNIKGYARTGLIW